MASTGMPQSMADVVTRPICSSMCRSVSSPRLTCRLTASAPSLMASSTVPTRVLALGKGDRDVLAERWTIRPMSAPLPRWEQRTSPLCRMMALAPPSATSLMDSRMSTSPEMGPTLTP
jgi:hypothetical protein